MLKAILKPLKEIVMPNLFEIQFLEWRIEYYTQRVEDATGQAKWYCRKELYNLKQRLTALLN